MKKSELNLSVLKNSLSTLKECYQDLKSQNDEKIKIYIKDSCIQRFEYTYEAAKKIMNKFLKKEYDKNDSDLTINNIFREMYGLGLIENFEKTLELLKQRGIVTILVNTPIAKVLNEYEPVAYQKFNDYIQSKVDSSSVYYWDLNPEYTDQYELFFDPIHLNVKGQQVINNVLADRFTSFIKNHDFNNNTFIQ